MPDDTSQQDLVHAGVVASILLVPLGLDCLGVSLVGSLCYLSEVSLVVAWSLMCNILRLNIFLT